LASTQLQVREQRDDRVLREVSAQPTEVLRWLGEHPLHVQAFGVGGRQRVQVVGAEELSGPADQERDGGVGLRAQDGLCDAQGRHDPQAKRDHHQPLDVALLGRAEDTVWARPEQRGSDREAPLSQRGGERRRRVIPHDHGADAIER